MRRSILVFILIIVIVMGVGWWGVNKGGWFTDVKLIQPTDIASVEDLAAGKSDLDDSEKDEKESFLKQRGMAIKAYKISRATFEDFLPAMGSIKGIITRKLNFEVPGIVFTYPVSSVSI